jgi:hypothetical protein
MILCMVSSDIALKISNCSHVALTSLLVAVANTPLLLLSPPLLDARLSISM